MAENESALTEGANTPTETASTGGEAAATAPAPEDTAPEAAATTEDISYHAVEKDGQVTAIWEMQGRKHLRTIDPRSRQGQDILRLYTAEHEHQG
jgi:hypothetical protein